METVLKGDAGGALTQLGALNRDGAEPGQVIADLADAVHAVTLVKAAGEASADPAQRIRARPRRRSRRPTADAGAGARLADAAQGL